MTLPRKILALTAGATLALSAAAITTTHAQQPAEPRSAGDVVQDNDASVEWIEKSQVAPLMEGNLEKIELEIGKTVEKNGTIGFLYRRKAELTVKKAEIAANSTGGIEKAEAQKSQAISVVARNDRLVHKDPNLVPKEDVEKGIAELKMAVAMIKEATEEQSLARAELELARNQLDEHTIKAPFSGVILKWLKKSGESVSAREPVVEMGNLDKLRVFAYLPVETATRVTEGMTVEFQPRISGLRGGSHPIESKKFRGVITFVDPQIQPINETAVRVYAEFPNPNHELRPGFKGTLTVLLNSGGAPPAPAARTETPAPAEAVAPAATVAAPAPSPAGDLPPLPR
jgi:RND family efflux transporter MFP subunit